MVFMMNPTSPEARRAGNLLLGLYAQHLASGQTLLSRTIRSGTIGNYIQNISSFLSLFYPFEIDFRKASPLALKLCPEITSVLAECKRWEDMERRREPFTLEMLKRLIEIHTEASASPDSLLVALSDWFTWGLFGGFRLSEWAQSSTSNIRTPERNRRDQTQAFLPNDLQFELFRTPQGRRPRPVGLDILAYPVEKVAKFWVTFRTQKNPKKDGQKILFSAAPTATFCPVRTVYRILERYRRIRDTGPVDFSPDIVPLSVYLKEGQVKLIYARDIEIVMRSLAADIYDFRPDHPDLQLWSSHSLRVGACVILHGMGYTENQLKFLLRWESNAFFGYLRNINVLTTNHTVDFNEVAEMPNFY
jgi:hypothetical protein